MDTLKQRAFASAFGSPDWGPALRRYYELFEKPEEQEDLDIHDFEPETEHDITAMLNEARRAGAIE